MIIEKGITKHLCFACISQGEVFEYQNTTYIKIGYKHPTNECECCVNLKNGDINFLYSTDEVELLRAKVVIE